jgi:hypothetical protein
MLTRFEGDGKSSAASLGPLVPGDASGTAVVAAGPPSFGFKNLRTIAAITQSANLHKVSIESKKALNEVEAQQDKHCRAISELCKAVKLAVGEVNDARASAADAERKRKADVEKEASKRQKSLANADNKDQFAESDHARHTSSLHLHTVVVCVVCTRVNASCRLHNSGPLPTHDMWQWGRSLSLV